MTNTKILEEVYRMVSNGYVADIQDDVKGFIEQEWQGHDDAMEKEAKDLYANTKYPDGQTNVNSKRWYTDVRDMERHRGLEIGPDGTVKKLK